jgi:hypothetical protein
MDGYLRELIEKREQVLAQAKLVADGMVHHQQFADKDALSGLFTTMRRSGVLICEGVALWRHAAPPGTEFTSAEFAAYLKKMLHDVEFVLKQPEIVGTVQLNRTRAGCSLRRAIRMGATRSTAGKNGRSSEVRTLSPALTRHPSPFPQCAALSLSPDPTYFNPLLAPSSLHLPTRALPVPTVTDYLVRTVAAGEQRERGGTAWSTTAAEAADAAAAAAAAPSDGLLPSPLTAACRSSSPDTAPLQMSLALSSKRIVQTASLLRSAEGDAAVALSFLGPDDLLSSDALFLLAQPHVKLLVDRVRLVSAHATLWEEREKGRRAEEVAQVVLSVTDSLLGRNSEGSASGRRSSGDGAAVLTSPVSLILPPSPVPNGSTRRVSFVIPHLETTPAQAQPQPFSPATNAAFLARVESLRAQMRAGSVLRPITMPGSPTGDVAARSVSSALEGSMARAYAAAGIPMVGTRAESFLPPPWGPGGMVQIFQNLPRPEGPGGAGAMLEAQQAALATAGRRSVDALASYTLQTELLQPVAQASRVPNLDPGLAQPKAYPDTPALVARPTPLPRLGTAERAHSGKRKGKSAANLAPYGTGAAIAAAPRPASRGPSAPLPSAEPTGPSTRDARRARLAAMVASLASKVTEQAAELAKLRALNEVLHHAERHRAAGGPGQSLPLSESQLEGLTKLGKKNPSAGVTAVLTPAVHLDDILPPSVYGYVQKEVHVKLPPLPRAVRAPSPTVIQSKRAGTAGGRARVAKERGESADGKAKRSSPKSGEGRASAEKPVLASLDTPRSRETARLSSGAGNPPARITPRLSPLPRPASGSIQAGPGSVRKGLFSPSLPLQGSQGRAAALTAADPSEPPQAPVILPAPLAETSDAAEPAAAPETAFPVAPEFEAAIMPVVAAPAEVEAPAAVPESAAAPAEVEAPAAVPESAAAPAEVFSE